MKRVVTSFIVIAGVAAFSSALAQTNSGFGHQIASTATVGEGTVSASTEIRGAVRTAVRGLIVREAPKAKDVLTGIDAVFTACRPPAGFKAAPGWTCPKTEEAYAALLELRTLVVAMEDAAAEPAAISGDGSAALSNFSTVSAGGANYTVF